MASVSRARACVAEQTYGEAVQKSLCCHMAGNLASRGASHTVAHHEGPMLGQSCAGVLVGAAHATAMGEHGKRNIRRAGHGLRRCGAYGSPPGRLHCRSICHSQPRIAAIWARENHTPCRAGIESPRLSSVVRIAKCRSKRYSGVASQGGGKIESHRAGR